MKYVEILKLIDILSPQPSLLVNTKERFKTLYGGVISVILIIMSLFSLSWFFAILLKKNELTVISSDSFNLTLNYSFKSQDRLFMFNAFTTRREPYINQEKLLNISALNIKYTYTKLPDGKINSSFLTIPLKTMRCNEQIVSQFLSHIKEINYSNYYCLAPNQTVYLENTPQSTDYYHYFNVYYSPCVNSSLNNYSCLDNETIKNTLSNFNNEVVVLSTYFTHDNLSQPSQVSVMKFYDPNSFLLYSQKYLYFQKYNYLTDDGFVFPNNWSESNLTYAKSYYAVSQISNNSYIPYAFNVNVFQLQPLSLHYNRSYKKAQTVVGEIGGLINSLFIAAGLITSYFSKKELHYHIFKNSMNLVDSKRM